MIGRTRETDEGLMAIDVAGLFAEREGDRYALHARYLNEQMVRVLRTVGFDRPYQRGSGQYLYDAGASVIWTCSVAGACSPSDATIQQCARHSRGCSTPSFPISCSSTSPRLLACWLSACCIGFLTWTR